MLLVYTKYNWAILLVGGGSRGICTLHECCSVRYCWSRTAVEHYEIYLSQMEVFKRFGIGGDVNMLVMNFYANYLLKRYLEYSVSATFLKMYFTC